MNDGSMRLFAIGLVGAFIAGLSACDKVDRPLSGNYRAAIELPGGELPFLLEIGDQANGIELSVRHLDAKQTAAQTGIENGRLRAELPNEAGKLDVSMRRKAWQGTLELQGKTWPLKAEYGVDYRFYKESVTDNADVSGHWRLICREADAPLQLELMQTHDQVDGWVRWTDGAALPLEGQVHKDDVALGALGAGLALLYKARVDGQGQLEGELWQGETQRHCVASPHKMAEAL